MLIRKFFVTAFAAAATLTVLANNFVPVTAPEVADVGGAELNAIRHSAPRGAARLSDQQTAIAAKRQTADPVAITYERVPDRILSVSPNLAEFVPHTPAVQTTANNAAPRPARAEPSNYFLTAWMQAPSAVFERMKLLAYPEQPSTDELATGGQSHAAEVATADAPSRDSALAVADLPVASEAVVGVNESVSSSISAQKLSAVPSAPVDSDILAGEAPAHDSVADADARIVRPRDEYIADEPKRILPVFLTAAFQAPGEIFQRARYAVEPAPPVSSAVLSEETSAHTAENVQENIHRFEANTVADAPSQTSLPVFLTAIADLPGSIFDRQRLVQVPDAPVSTDALNAVAEHSSESVPEETQLARANEAKPDAPSSTLPVFLNAIAEVPSAVFQKMGLIEMPAAPVLNDSLTASNTDHAAVPVVNTIEVERPMPAADTVAAQSPVMITANRAVSNELLKPMSAGPLADAPLVNENAIAGNYSNPTPFDRMIAAPDIPEAIAKANPVLISGSPEFSMSLLKPMNSAATPFVKIDKNEQAFAALVQRDGFCDPNFVGPPIRFSQTVQLKLEDLINQLHQRFGVNFILGDGIAELPLNVKAGSIPWNVLLRSQLFISGVRATCLDANTIQLVKNDDIPNLQDSAEAKPNFVKLRFLQPGISQNISITGQASGGQGGGGGGGGQGCGGGGQGGGGGGQGGGGGGGGGQQGCGNFEKLIIEIEKILGIRSLTESSVGGGGGGGGSQGGNTQTTEVKRTNRSVTVIPGRNILVVRATPEEMVLIREIIALADRPPFQVVIRGLVYTANEDKLKDIGGQVSALVGTANGNTLGGVTSQPNTGGTSVPPPNPGGVPTLGDGFLFPTGGGDAIFGVSTIVGTAQFSAQINLLQQDGVISVKNRPFAVVLDGEGTSLDVGRKIPIIINAVNDLGGDGGSLQILDASNILQVIPQVVDDESGNPIAVNLILRLESNDVDSSVVTQGVPAIARRSIQSRLILNEDKTVILGGFTVDSDSKSTTKAPGLGDIPGLGWLFKRKVRTTQINRLYFALSVSIVPFGQIIEPVAVPGANTDIPSLTPPMKDRSDKAEPKQVVTPKTTGP